MPGYLFWTVVRTAGPFCHSHSNHRKAEIMAVIEIDSHKDTLAGCLIDAAGAPMGLYAFDGAPSLS